MTGITGLNSASIFVADLPLHVDFYVNELGFTVLHDESSERAAMLQAGEADLGAGLAQLRLGPGLR